MRASASRSTASVQFSVSAAPSVAAYAAIVKVSQQKHGIFCELHLLRIVGTEPRLRRLLDMPDLSARSPCMHISQSPACIYRNPLHAYRNPCMHVAIPMRDCCRSKPYP